MIKKHAKHLFFISLIMVFVLSSLPQMPTPKIKLLKSIIRLDYAIHLVIFLILALFFVLWRLSIQTRITFCQFLLFALFGIILAFANEFYQLLIPGRTFNPIDAIMNTTGFILGLGFIIVLIKINQIKTHSDPNEKATY